ncbi:nitric oxide reductase NorE protein [Acidovorax sp. 107]|uniref:cytochrome c oxidase subunit 3 family protein n=1 Tax=Acidovorax sp. 107 TaxID=2135638 RepID=UPI000D36BE83|nr:cytochrome c oxidase subunit 3 family protein [Acidovorax sp. 107]PUA97365.1 nitric oxide reductase NorE protein [Acidovorax sp. 107]
MAAPSDSLGALSKPEPAPAQRLPGDLVVWLLVLAELLTFGILFASFAVTRVRERALFAAGQATLDLSSGAINTVLLVSASWCVARSVHAVRAGQSGPGARWLLGALTGGCGFLVLKTLEYVHKWNEGIDVAENSFYLLYVMLTGFHFLHAAVGCIIFAVLWGPTRRGAYGPGNCHALETGAVFWHMVDLLWMLLFPLVYVLR